MWKREGLYLENKTQKIFLLEKTHGSFHVGDEYIASIAALGVRALKLRRSEQSIIEIFRRIKPWGVVMSANNDQTGISIMATLFSRVGVDVVLGTSKSVCAPVS